MRPYQADDIGARLEMSDFHKSPDRHNYSALSIDEARIAISDLKERYCVATVLHKFEMVPRGIKKIYGVKLAADIKQEQAGMIEEVRAEGLETTAAKYEVPPHFFAGVYGVPTTKKGWIKYDNKN